MKHICDSCEKYPCSADETKLRLSCPAYSPKPKPITNADRIRSMTDEELAEWFIKVQDDVADYYDGGHAFAPELPTMENSWLDWLKQEVE